MDYVHHYESPLGGITLGSDGEALTGLWFENQKYYGMVLNGECREGNLAVFEQTAAWLDIYFSGEEPSFTPPLLLRGTAFRKAVWNVLLSIPYGHTMTYGQIAGLIAEKKGLPHMSSQAVGGAVGHNPISLIIPCHRVIGADGNLTGYAGGLERKAALLELEGHAEILQSDRFSGTE